MANRSYTPAQRTAATGQVIDDGLAPGLVARDMSVGIGTVHRWVAAELAARGNEQHAPLAGVHSSTALHRLRASLMDAETRLDRLQRRIADLSDRTSTDEEHERAQVGNLPALPVRAHSR